MSSTEDILGQRFLGRVQRQRQSRIENELSYPADIVVRIIPSTYP